MILYVSWGGTGRAAGVRQAMRQAVVQETNSDSAVGKRGLRYLAVLDDDHFADLDRYMLQLVIDELEWLLDTQLELTRNQLGAEDLAVDVVVRTGDVIECVVDVLGERGPAEVVIGAPVAAVGHDSIEAMTSHLEARIRGKVSVVVPPESDEPIIR